MRFFNLQKIRFFLAAKKKLGHDSSFSYQFLPNNTTNFHGDFFIMNIKEFRFSFCLIAQLIIVNYDFH
jgi:hypothetical protein